MGEELAIRCEGLTRYHGATPGVVDLDLEVPRGEVFGFISPNGAGKNTTIRLMLDLLRPDQRCHEVIVRLPAPLRNERPKITNEQPRVRQNAQHVEGGAGAGGAERGRPGREPAPVLWRNPQQIGDDRERER